MARFRCESGVKRMQPVCVDLPFLSIIDMMVKAFRFRVEC